MMKYMDGFSSIINVLMANHKPPATSELFATFGSVHLNVTSLEKATWFWTKIAGMKVRKATPSTTEFGSDQNTLVVVHQSAQNRYQKGYSGLYHVAIHAGSNAEFAKMVYRVIQQNYPCSPTDHTMSKSLYMEDPDGITIEFTLETPERFKRVVTTAGLAMEDSNGIIRQPSAPLNLDDVMKDLDDKDTTTVISNNARIGHIHLYANNVDKLCAFYLQLGFLQFNYLPRFLYADVGAGGAYQHRIAMNAWHGTNKPLAPATNAGLRYFQIVFHSKQKLDEALSNITSYTEKDGSFCVTDPTGNTILLSHA